MTAFTPPPAGMLSEQTDLPDYSLTLGLMHREGEGIRICAWDGARWRHLTSDAAIRWAQQLEADANATALLPVTDAIRALVDKVSEIETSAMFRRVSRNVGMAMRQPLAEMVIEGNA